MLYRGGRSPSFGTGTLESATQPPSGMVQDPRPTSVSQARSQVKPWLDAMSEKNLSMSQIESSVHRSIDNNPKLQKQLKRALEAGGQEALKSIFAHPLIRISSAAVKAWVEEAEEP
ncbi:MAG: hypothetical protein AAF685_02120 [Cyanobacteria bacterium P01_C01_bin.89]